MSDPDSAGRAGHCCCSDWWTPAPVSGEECFTRPATGADLSKWCSVMLVQSTVFILSDLINNTFVGHDMFLLHCSTTNSYL